MSVSSSVRRLWIAPQSRDLQDCWESLLALLLLDDATEPFYVFLAELADGPALENGFGQFDLLLPHLAGEAALTFSDVVRELGGRRPVRIAAPRSPRAEAFADAVGAQVEIRLGLDRPGALGLADSAHHLAGALRMTPGGIEAIGGPVTYAAGEQAREERRIQLAVMERIWTLLAGGYT